MIKLLPIKKYILFDNIYQVSIFLSKDKYFFNIFLHNYKLNIHEIFLKTSILYRIIKFCYFCELIIYFYKILTIFNYFYKKLF